MANSSIGWNIARRSQLPPCSNAIVERWQAGNGIFSRSTRPEMEALVQISDRHSFGLPLLEPYFHFYVPKVPIRLVAEILARSREVGEREILFYLNFARGTWDLNIPEQVATSTSVRPLQEVTSSYTNALIEVHSHHTMPAFFSPQDDCEESGKFRIFAVMGQIFTRPTISVRLGIYDCFSPLSATLVFELPTELTDAMSCL